MKGLWLALTSMSVCMAGPAFAQGLSPTKSMQLSRVILDTETSPIKARVKGGTLCVFPSNIEMPKEKKTQDIERFDGLFSREMKQRGFTIVSSAGDLFAAESEAKGDFLVGAIVAPEAMNICSSVNGFKGTIVVNVEWQIYDRSAQAIVETVTTSGEGTLAAFSAGGYNEMWNLAFTDALQALSEQDVFRRLVGEPGPVQVADVPGAATPVN